MPKSLFTLSRRSALRLLPGVALNNPLQAFAGTGEQELPAIEARIGVRLGFAALDTGTGHLLSHRGAELFPMCSTFKFLLAAFVLSKVDAGTEQLSRAIPYSENELLGYVAVTRARVKEGALPIGDLCAAAVELSDNSAANLLLAQVGGPAGLTQFLRSMGDQVTRLDRAEPDLNTSIPGDPRDTTSPTAMIHSMKVLLTGSVLSGASKAQLIAWLEKCKTGGQRLRAGIPKGWRAGDKTGTGDNGAVGDLGIFWPPGKAPILMAAYVAGGSATKTEREAAIASAARVVVRTRI